MEFDSSAFEDFAWWTAQDRKKALKIIKVIEEIQRNPFVGIGQPEMLKYKLAGCWSRRIMSTALFIKYLTTKLEF